MENTKDELERRVRKRTEELENLNVILKKEITERKIYQEQLHSLASRLSQIEEQERRRIASALHDEVAQSLALAKMKLDNLMVTKQVEPVLNQIDEIYHLIDQNIQEIRTFMFEISPPVLYEMGLIPAILWLARTFEEKHQIETTVKNDNLPKPLDNDLNNILFQIVRELLNNIQKHACAKQCIIQIQRDNNHIKISVQDDGIGFDVSTIKPDMEKLTKFGLFNIRERISYSKGNLNITSSPNKGSCIVVTMPLKTKK